MRHKIRFAAPLLLFPVLLLASVWAAAAETKSLEGMAVYQDEGGFPRCLERAGEVSILLKWKAEEKYEREIFAVPLTAHLADMILHDGKRSDRSVRDRLRCEGWERISAATPSFYGTAIPADAREINGFVLSESLRTALREVRLGADESRDGQTAEQYLAAHPLTDFDTVTNRDLTARYGVGFASEVFTKWVESQPRNREFRDAALAHLASGDSLADGALAPLFRDRVVIQVPGLAHETKSAKRLDVFTDQLKRLGVPIIVVQSGSMDPVVKNVEITRRVFDDVLRTGKNVIVLAQSKGGTEAIEALAELSDKLEGPERPAGYGRVEAYIGMSGVYAPSFLIDWAGHPPQWWFIKSKLKSALIADGATNISTLDGFLDLQTAPMEEFSRRVVAKGLPRETVYLSVVGAIEGNGLARDPSVRQAQDDLIRTQLSGYGANDGYIEYPGTLLPSEWAPKQYAVVVNGSHALVDGSFDGKNLKEAAPDSQVASALMKTLFQFIEKNR